MPNALVPNALVPNALVPNALAASALMAIQDSGQAGALSRMHLKYTVGCALDSTQSFSFSWTDSLGLSHNETYVGMLGLATGWASGPLGVSAQEWISACLAARTNYYGTPVIISSRGSCGALNTVNTSEAAAYANEEGAFWGNIYTSTPALYSCHVSADDTNSRRQLRDCAAGHLNPNYTVSSCGMIQIVGACDRFCLSISSPGLPHLSCWSDPNNKISTGTLAPVTIYLPAVGWGPERD